MQVAQGDLKAALKSYSDSLAIRERLAQSDPGNAGWQRDLSVSYDKVGDVQVAQGDLKAALKSYSDSLAIRRAPGEIRPRQCGLAARSLGVSYDKIGDVQVAQGDLKAALKSYSDSLAITERLAKSDPGNADWQRDLSVSFGKLASVHRAIRRQCKGARLFSARPGDHGALDKTLAGQCQWKKDLAWFNQQIAELAAQQDLSQNSGPEPEPSSCAPLDDLDRRGVVERRGVGMGAEHAFRQKFYFVAWHPREQVFDACPRARQKPRVQAAFLYRRKNCLRETPGAAGAGEMRADHHHVAAGFDQAHRGVRAIEKPFHRAHADIVGDGYSRKTKFLAQNPGRETARERDRRIRIDGGIEHMRQQDHGKPRVDRGGERFELPRAQRIEAERLRGQAKMGVDAGIAMPWKMLAAGDDFFAPAWPL